MKILQGFVNVLWAWLKNMLLKLRILIRTCSLARARSPFCPPFYRPICRNFVRHFVSYSGLCLDRTARRLLRLLFFKYLNIFILLFYNFLEYHTYNKDLQKMLKLNKHILIFLVERSLDEFKKVSGKLMFFGNVFFKENFQRCWVMSISIEYLIMFRWKK